MQLTRQPVIENANLFFAGSVALHDEIRVHELQILFSVCLGCSQLESCPTLPHVRLEDKRVGNRMLFTEPSQHLDALRNRRRLQRIPVRNKLRRRTHESPEDLDLRLADDSAIAK